MKTTRNSALVALLLAGSGAFADNGVQAVKQTLQAYEQGFWCICGQ